MNRFSLLGKQASKKARNSYIQASKLAHQLAASLVNTSTIAVATGIVTLFFLAAILSANIFFPFFVLKSGSPLLRKPVKTRLDGMLICLDMLAVDGDAVY